MKAMKTLCKILTMLVVLAGLLALAVALLQKKREDSPEYITIYGGPEDEG